MKTNDGVRRRGLALAMALAAIALAGVLVTAVFYVMNTEAASTMESREGAVRARAAE